jgi:hypothetical protein
VDSLGLDQAIALQPHVPTNFACRERSTGAVIRGDTLTIATLLRAGGRFSLLRQASGEIYLCGKDQFAALNFSADLRGFIRLADIRSAYLLENSNGRPFRASGQSFKIEGLLQGLIEIEVCTVHYNTLQAFLKHSPHYPLAAPDPAMPADVKARFRDAMKVALFAAADSWTEAEVQDEPESDFSS